MIERQSQILEHVVQQGRADVVDLADRFGVSQVTVRKDLDHLEDLGLVKRQHGAAVPYSPDDMRARLALGYDNKVRIAKAAAATVHDGETIMIESGSCCAILAREIATSTTGCTLVTNSAFIADYVRHSPSLHVVLLGGDYQPESQVTVGPLAEAAAANFFVDKLFIGVDGYTADDGFTARDHLRAVTVRALARQAEHVVVLSESEKFGRRGSVKLLPSEEVDVVVTDEQIPEDLAAGLRDVGTTLIIVEEGE